VISKNLLQLLSDGQWHSGKAIGEQFDVSRAAIWKQIETVRGYGLTVESDRGKGYRLVDAIQLGDADKIKAGLNKSLLIDVINELSIDSTNTYALQLLQDNKQAIPFVVFADHQTAGRGRRGRRWLSPLGRSLYCSLAWRLDLSLAELSGLSLVVAIAIKEVLDRRGIQGLQLKWPNDLLADSRKLAGILIELQGEASGPCTAVIGIGLNLSLSELKDVPDKEITQPWIDLKQLSASEEPIDDVLIDKNQLSSELINAIASALVEFEAKGFAVFVERWRSADFLSDKPVNIESGGQVVQGHYLGVLQDGSIQIKSDQGVQTIVGGEISVRALA